MKGMTLRAMTQAVNGIYHGNGEDYDKEITAITIDSRKVAEGGLFIAIKGERSDGHDFIGQCFEKGAACVISEKELPDEERSYIQVESSLQALKDLALLYRNNLDVKVVGITGSVGKTSTSDFGEMDRLSKIAQPDICVITNIGFCHLENLGTRDGILKAKTEIFNHMNPDGIVIVNGDDDKLSTISQVHGKRPLVFGISNKDGVYADNIKSLGLDGTSFTIHGIKTSDNYSTFDLTVPVPGHHMVYNAMAAALVGSVLGLSSIEIERGVKNLKTIAGRNNIIKENGFTIIDDCYNANPVSMKASLDVLDTAIGRKVAILGSMFELGENEKQMHYDVGMYLGTKDIDVLITAGDLAAQIAAGTRAYIDTNYNAHGCEVHDFETRDDMLKCIGHILKTGDNILIKASHGMEFTKVVEALKTINL